MSRMEKYHNVKPVEETPPKKEVPNKQQPPISKKKKKKHRGSVAQSFGKLLLLFVIMIIAFFLYEYKKGYNEAKHDEDFGKIEIQDFHGVKSNDGSLNVLLLGSDSRGEDIGRSDSIMIAHYNKKEKKPKLVSFMRDTYVRIPGYDPNKINASYSYGGPELVRQTIKESFNIDVEYYAIVNFESFPKIIDSLCPKGVELDAEKDLDLDGVFIKQGLQKMNGHTALQYARFRKDEEGDFGRVRRQQQVMNALFKQGLSIKNIVHLPETVGKVQGYTSTDLPPRVYPGIGKDFVLGLSKPLEKLVIPVENSWSDGYYDHAGSVLEIDKEMNAQAIQAFFNN